MSFIYNEPIAWFNDLFETDTRILLIVATARIDDQLGSLLQAVLLHKTNRDGRLFGPDRPLGSFSSRIILAYHLGLIDHEFESFLQIARRLRNDAAHSTTPINLSVAPHLDRVQSLYNIASRTKLWKEMDDRHHGRLPKNVREQGHQCLALSLQMAVLNLEAARHEAKPLLNSPVFTLNWVGAQRD